MDRSYSPESLGISTRIAHFGEEDHLLGAVVPPLFQNSLFVFDTIEELQGAIQNEPWGPPFHYSRVGNPTLDLAEKKIANLEGADACKLVGSGMAAMTLGILGSVEAGSHAVLVDGVYGPVRMLFENTLSRLGITHTFVDGCDTDAVIDAIRPETTLVYLESPTSLTFRLQDIEAIARACREKGVLTMIDSTYNTPLHLNPIELGVDVVAHSLTKYFGGHSDLTAGAILSNDTWMKRYVRSEGLMFGGSAAPFVAWLVTRGMRTLPLRMKAHEAAGTRVAQYLEGKPQIAKVNHIALESHPQHELFKRQFKGSGGLFSIEPKTQDKEKIFAFCNRLKLFGRGISWGGFESLVTTAQVKPCDYDDPTWFIRLFIGLEDVNDLIADIEAALPALD